jgi:hypothetical protein
VWSLIHYYAERHHDECHYAECRGAIKCLRQSPKRDKTIKPLRLLLIKKFDIEQQILAQNFYKNDTPLRPVANVVKLFVAAIYCHFHHSVF